MANLCLTEWKCTCYYIFLASSVHRHESGTNEEAAVTGFHGCTSEVDLTGIPLVQ